MRRNGRTVSRRPDRSWAKKKDGASLVGSRHDTQREAIEAARQLLISSGGRELKVIGADGKIQSTIPPDNDHPNPPRASEHLSGTNR